MLNLSVGSVEEVDGQRWLRSRSGAIGHALYGPYVTLEPGHYLVEFNLRLFDDLEGADDLVCCFADVTSEFGQKTFAMEPVLASQIKDGRPFALGFTLGERAEVEFRLHMNGRVSLAVADNTTVQKLDRASVVPKSPTTFMAEHRPMMKRLHDMGVRMSLVDDRFVMDKGGVRFNARIYDDVNFVHEIFALNAYNVFSGKPTCIIDIGMNVALAALLFSTKPFVKEVHAFEPFYETFLRGKANIDLNPQLSAKIHAYNFGLANGLEGDVTLRIHQGSDSGAASTLDWEGGSPTQLPMRDVAKTLQPIISRAKEKGLDIILKVDCEGSEFPIFEALAAADMFGSISAFMVEWHRIFQGRDQTELLKPLLAAGFIVFDITPPEGNGFFYAVRAH